MNDISEFMKTFKEAFNVRFKRGRGYTGSIWSGRFKSTLVEGGRYLEICRRYVYLNPVRAGIVRRAADYAWCWIAPPDAPFAGSRVGWRCASYLPRWVLTDLTDFAQRTGIVL